MDSIKIAPEEIGNDHDMTRVYSFLSGNVNPLAEMNLPERVKLFGEIRSLARKATAAFGILTVASALTVEAARSMKDKPFDESIVLALGLCTLATSRQWGQASCVLIDAERASEG